jgi:hypothetical protein
VGVRIFLLSPAHCGGQRARLALRDEARFDLARRLRSGEGAPLGEVFSFLSGLYFRGKLAYASAFARAIPGRAGVLVITPCEGLRPPDLRVGVSHLRRYAEVDIASDDPRYREPLLRDARALLASLEGLPTWDVVLLGSVASSKYVDLLTDVFGDRLLFPTEFVGRGDMSRGGLLLRSVSEGRELDCRPLLGAARRGRRPPRLVPRPGILRAALGGPVDRTGA